MAYNNVVNRSDVQALIEEQVSDIMLTSLPQQSTALQMFTRINVPTNKTRFPVLSALPVAYFVDGDTGIKQTTEAAWDNKYINIEELAAIVPIPDAVFEDASFDIWGTIRPLLEAAIARTLDAAIFFGTSAPTSWPDDVVKAATAAGNKYTRGTNAANKGGVAEDLNQLNDTLLADGFAATGIVAKPQFQTLLRSARDANGQMLADVSGGTTSVWGIPTSYPLVGQWPADTTTGKQNAELIALQRENFVIGVRSDFKVTVSDSAILMDASKAIQYNMFQQDMTAYRIVFRVGWQVNNPITYAEDTEANRYPAAVLLGPVNA